VFYKPFIQKLFDENQQIASFQISHKIRTKNSTYVSKLCDRKTSFKKDENKINQLDGKIGDGNF